MFLILALKRDSFSILYVVLKISVGPANVLVEMCKVDLYFWNQVAKSSRASEDVNRRLAYLSKPKASGNISKLEVSQRERDKKEVIREQKALTQHSKQQAKDVAHEIEDDTDYTDDDSDDDSDGQDVPNVSDVSEDGETANEDAEDGPNDKKRRKSSVSVSY